MIRSTPADTSRLATRLGAYRYARTVLAVLTGPAEVGNHGDDLIRRRPLGRIYHQQELHEVLGGRRSGLYDENGTSADTLLERGLEFAVAEPADRQVTQFASVTLGNLRGQFMRTAARKDFQFVNSHQCKLLRDFCFVCYLSAKVRYYPERYHISVPFLLRNFYGSSARRRHSPMKPRISSRPERFTDEVRKTGGRLLHSSSSLFS